MQTNAILVSAIETLLFDLARIKYSPGVGWSGEHWRAEADECREILAKSDLMEAETQQLIDDAWQSEWPMYMQRKYAAPEICPWGLHEVITIGWFPEPMHREPYRELRLATEGK